jgi:DNA-directed RNA polymerase subunit RPC12/RpoP
MPTGVAEAYIAAYTNPGDQVLDPFCEGEAVLREAAAAGRAVLAVNFNPIAILAVRGLAGLADRQILDAALTRLGDALKAGRPLREHLNALYSAPCIQCHRPVPAEYLIWNRDRGEPTERYYHCPACGSGGLVPVRPADLEALEHIDPRGFSYWYTLDRIAPSGDPGRDQARRLLDIYTPRALHALTTLLIKVETLYPDAPQQEALKWILLRCLEQCHSLYAADEQDKGEMAWSRSLRPPARFIERNVWLTFQRASELARQAMSSPALPLSDQVRIQARSVRRLSQELPAASIALIVTVPPAYDYPFWALSYLWNGWLLGPEAAAALKPLLEYRRPDWDWYRRALTAAWRALRPTLRDDGHVVLVFTTRQFPLLEVSLLALDSAGYELEHSIVQVDEARQDRDYRLVFSPELERRSGQEIPVPDILDAAIRRTAVGAAQRVIRLRGEPLTWSHLHAAIYAELAREGLLRQAVALFAADRQPGEFVAQAVSNALETCPELARIGGPEPGDLGEGESAGEEPLRWWLTNTAGVSPPLADRVEEAVYESLRDSLALGKEALLEQMYLRFPGLLTPAASLIDACLVSYGVEITPGYWQLRPEDLPKHREREREQVLEQLFSLGRRLGYTVAEGDITSSQPWDVVWIEGQVPAYAFIVRWTAILGDLLFDKAAETAEVRCLVIPGGRASLINYKMWFNPLLRRAVVRGGWQFIKYRHLRRIVAAPDLTRHDLKRIVGLDPIIEQFGAQIPLF